MPRIQVTCPSGSHEFFYSISTPTATCATAIDKDRPTILFIHSSYQSQEVFENQFADPEIRQFNLVAVDNLGHGMTRGMIGDQRYTPTETAHDLKCVMDALGLPPCHVFGLSLGGKVGLELASAYPSQVLSLTICSPVTPTELEEVIDGRVQVYQYWLEVFRDVSGEGKDNAKRQEELLNETLHGGTQLLYNNEDTRLTRAIGRCGMVRAIDIWSGSPEKLKQGYTANVLWLTERHAIPKASFSKMTCRVDIIYCSEDVGYPEENAQALLRDLQEAGVAQTSLHVVAGPHYGNLTHPEGINPILRAAVFSASNIEPDTLSIPKPDYAYKMRTPWTDLLRRMGYEPEDTDSDSDSDFEYRSWFAIPPVVPDQRTQPVQS